MNNRKIYISGPMSGIANENKPAFDKMEKLINETFPEWIVLSPARHPYGLPYKTYMQYAMIDVENSDLLVLLDGYSQSNGARDEIQRAVQLGKDFITEALLYDKFIHE